MNNSDYGDIILLLFFLIIIIVVLGKWWVYVGKKNIFVKVETIKIADFQDNLFEVTYVIENRSILPFPNLHLFTALHRNIDVEGLSSKSINGYYNYYLLNFSLQPKSKLSKTICCKANMRGSYLFGDITLFLLDPFSISTLRLNVYYTKEIGIYPKIFPIHIPKEQLSQINGNKKVNFSLLEERLLPKGAREYSPTDPFTKVDWKQSSKINQLFTKEFEYTSHQQFMILVNLKISDQPYSNNDEKVEQIISTVASLAYRLSTNNVSYNILMNIKLAKSKTLYKLSASSKKDLKNVLYQLARLKSYTTVNYVHALRMAKDGIGPNRPTIILISLFLSEEARFQINRLKRERYKVIWINPLTIEREEYSDELLAIYK